MIMEKATELGMALSNSWEFKRVQAAKSAMDSDEHVTTLMKQYTEKQAYMVSILEEAEPDGMNISALSKELEDIQSELAENPVFIEMMESQQQFAMVMNQVNKIIGAYIGLKSQEDEGGCGGNCQGCSGCMH